MAIRCISAAEFGKLLRMLNPEWRLKKPEFYGVEPSKLAEADERARKEAAARKARAALGANPDDGPRVEVGRVDQIVGKIAAMMPNELVAGGGGRKASRDEAVGY